MESEPGVALGTFYQHQFFPGGCDPLQQNHTSLSLDPPEAKWGRYPAERNDWDVKAWNWDSVLFLAQPSSGSQRLSSESEQGAAGQDIHSGGVKRALGLSANSLMQEHSSPPPDGTKSLMVDDGSPDDDAECLTLKLGGHTYSSVEDTARNGKRQRSSSPGSQQQQYPMCQVDDCKADLSTAKDYHRRHKVCETHSKASKALVARLMQRFCQQCSRFHPLQEFDEGKRSCRRRLAGHNRRRRKTQPDAAAAQAYLLAEEDLAGKSAGILRLLQLLSQLQAASTMEKVTTAVQDRELALEYLRRAASVSSALGDFTSPKVEGNVYRSSANGGVQRPEMKFNEPPLNGYLSPDAQLLSALSGTPLMEMLLQSNLKGQLPATKETSEQLMSHMLQNGRTATSLNRGAEYVPREHGFSLPSAIPRTRSPVIPPVTTQDQSVVEVIPDGSPTVHKLFPLQSAAGSSGAAGTGRDVGAESGDMGRPSLLALLAGDKPIPSSPVVASASNLQSVQSQQSSESQSGSDQSPESSYAADLQERTGRISFKLFDRNPGDFPQLLRSQILEWLSHVPSDMESYIRPGCVLLAIFLSMPGSAWEKLCGDLLGNLKRLVNASDTDFWNKGRILVQICDQTAYIVDGEVQAVNSRSRNLPHILGITPLAMVTGQKTKFVLEGFDLARPDTRIFCAYQGNYSPEPWTEHEEVELEEGRLTFTHGPCDVIGRCFIEVEGDDGSSFVPVIVADDAVCKELRNLEDEIETASSRAAMVAERYAFPEEDRWEFIDSVQLAVERESARFLHDLGWVFQRRCWQLKGRQYPEGIQQSGAMKSLLVFALERQWCAVLRTLLDILFSLKRGQTDAVTKVLEDVNLLHRAVSSNSLAMVELLLSYKAGSSYVFSPDVVGPSGLTPLHVAACMRGSEGVIGALTSDPAQVGLQAWDSARDSFGQTPFDCAASCGHLTYIQMVWSAKGKSGQVVVDIPLKPLENIKAQQSLELPVWVPSAAAAAAAPGKLSSECCKLEQRRRERHMAGIRGPMYKPFMLSMVAIAAVCVCVCLLLKGPPQVRFVLEPFTWESVHFGPK